MKECVTREYICQIYQHHNNDAMMGAIASQTTSLTTVYSNVYSGADETSKLRVTALCGRNSPVTGEFTAQRASKVKKCFHLLTSSWWYVTISALGSHWISLTHTIQNSFEVHLRLLIFAMEMSMGLLYSYVYPCVSAYTIVYHLAFRVASFSWTQVFASFEIHIKEPWFILSLLLLLQVYSHVTCTDITRSIPPNLKNQISQVLHTVHFTNVKASDK